MEIRAVDSTCPLSMEIVALVWARWWSGVRSDGGVAGASAGESASSRKNEPHVGALKMASERFN